MEQIIQPFAVFDADGIFPVGVIGYLVRIKPPVGSIRPLRKKGLALRIQHLCLRHILIDHLADKRFQRGYLHVYDHMPQAAGIPRHLDHQGGYRHRPFVLIGSFYPGRGPACGDNLPD
ncbi:hypothetical protein D3C81_1542410 [compost metagenome]